MIVEIHILQNFAPSCLNRDDTNSPKDCEFGGFRRARISSQCIKRAIRWHPRFRDEVGLVFAKRSYQHAREIAQRVSDKTGKPLKETHQVARFVFQRMGFKEKQRTDRLTVLLFLGSDEIGVLADAVEQHWETLNPLANENILREELATRLAELLVDLGDDAEMLGRLIANHRAGKANASAIKKWLELDDDNWHPAIEAVRDMPEEFCESLRAMFAVDVEAEDAGNEDGEDVEYVPKKAATLFNSKKNQAVSDALKRIDLKKDKDASTATTAEEKAKRRESAKQLKAIFGPLKKLTTKAVDVAMFGRMLAEIKSGDMNVDAACQVAHAISTNKLSAMEVDFFTAVEELKDLAKEQGVEQIAGAGMMGATEFNSACFYRYANIDLEQLKENLQGDADLARKTVMAFLRASVEAIPTGKQNSMAAQNPPSLVLAVVRESGFWSLANAFVRPVSAASHENLVVKSIEALRDHWNQLVKVYGDDGIEKSCVTLEDIDLKDLNQSKNLNGLVKQVLDAISGNGEVKS